MESSPSSPLASAAVTTAERTRTPVRLVVRWIARVVLAVVALLVVAMGGVYGISERRFRTRLSSIPEHPIAVSEDAASVVRGEHIATVRGCVECHGTGLSGNTIVDQPVIGRLSGPNLTLGGRGAELEPRDWERAVRHGLRRDGRPLLFMPANEFTVLTDEDLAAIIAYARSVPRVSRRMPASYAGPMLRAAYVSGKVQIVPAEVIAHGRAHERRLVAEPTVTYGKYLASGCTGCHGEGLSGGKIPGAPPDWGPAANITPTGIGRWTEADFERALREGRRPDGSAIDSSLMPIRLLRQMDEVELAALYAYLRTVPPREYGNR